MLRQFKPWLALMLVMAGVRQDSAFTIWGPIETWQSATLSYSTRFYYAPSFYTTFPIDTPVYVPGNVPYTELGGPKNFGEGSRINVGVITYAFDDTFLSYYGPDGVKAVDAAFAILNRLPTVSSASPNLTEFITDGNQQINYTARALSMLDLKSVVLQLMMEQMGLLGETHVYDLAERVGTTCGVNYVYDVIVRNYDPITWNPSTYVNGTHYDYAIADNCSWGGGSTGGGVTLYADALEQASDQVGGGLSTTTAAVATQEALQLGGYYLGITRDDFGGLRYLYRKGNFNNEALPTDCYMGLSGTSSPYGQVTTNATSLLTSGLGSSSPFSPVSTNGLTNGGVALSNGFSGILGGVEKITFVKVAYASLVGDVFTATNLMTYTIPLLTNYTVQPMTVLRSNTKPDLLFTSADLFTTTYATTATANSDEPYTRLASWIAAPVTPAAPYIVSEVVMPTNLFTFNNVGPMYVNENPEFMGSSAYYMYPYFQFGSFDGSTNAPIAFPRGTSLAALLALELTAPPGVITSPFNPLVTSNTVAATGTGAGPVAAGTGGTAAAGGAIRTQPAGLKSAQP